MLNTFIVEKNGDVYMNKLRRFVMSGTLVPTQNNAVIKVPKALGPNNPGVSLPFTIEGPQDSHSEVSYFVGQQGLRKLGTGTVSALAAGVAVTGVGTQFTQELLGGDQIVVVDTAMPTHLPQIRTVDPLVPITDTTFSVTVAFPNAVTNSVFAYWTPVAADVSNNLFVEITDTAWGRRLMNRPVPVQHVYGSAQRPCYLYEKILLERNQTLLHKFYNYSTVANGSFSISKEARKWQDEAMKEPEVKSMLDTYYKRKIWFTPYWFTLDEGSCTIPAGGTQVAYFSSPGDAWLFLINVYGYAYSTGGMGDNQEKVSCELSNIRTGRAYQSQPFTVNTGMGTAENPFILPCPIAFEPRNQIKAVFRNLITTAPTTIWMTLMGVSVLRDSISIKSSDVLRAGQSIYNSEVPSLEESSVRA